MEGGINKVHNKLKAKRVELNLTQIEISKLLNMEVATYSRKEKGLTQFRLDEVQRLLDILGCKFEDIFK